MVFLAVSSCCHTGLTIFLFVSSSSSSCSDCALTSLLCSSLQPDVHPGDCWAFQGSSGYLVIGLSMRVVPTAFSLEHIPKSLSPTGHIESAPRDFSVYVSTSRTQATHFHLKTDMIYSSVITLIRLYMLHPVGDRDFCSRNVHDL